MNNKKPNVFLITIDSLRADRLGFMGHQKKITPNIDSFSERCTIFSNAFAVGPNTPYSFPAILTGTYPLDYQGPKKMERPRVFISEYLKEEYGYTTAAIHSNPRLSSFFGYNKGWDYFEDITPPSQMKYKKIFKESLRKKTAGVIRSSCVFFPQLFFRLKYLFLRPKIEDIKVKAEFINQIAKDFISSQKERKESFFLWLHYMDVHGPYLPFEWYIGKKSQLSFEDSIAKSLPAFFKNNSWFLLRKFIRKYLPSVINCYDDGVKYVDKKIGELLDFLKKEELYNDAIIILAADHGEEFLEHGEGSHNNKLYNELLKVPLLIKTPFQNKSKIIQDKVSLINIPATICSLARIKIPPFFKGEDLFTHRKPIVFHQTASFKKTKEESRNPYSDIDIKDPKQCVLAVQDFNWKYILDYSENKELLYNLSDDPQEQKNLSSSQPEVLVRMRKKIREFEKKNPPLSLIS